MKQVLKQNNALNIFFLLIFVNIWLSLNEDKCFLPNFFQQNNSTSLFRIAGLPVLTMSKPFNHLHYGKESNAVKSEAAKQLLLWYCDQLRCNKV